MGDVGVGGGGDGIDRQLNNGECIDMGALSSVTQDLTHGTLRDSLNMPLDWV